MLPHNGGFPVVTVAFIQFIRPNTHVLARKGNGVNELEWNKKIVLPNERVVAQWKGWRRRIVVGYGELSFTQPQ